MKDLLNMHESFKAKGLLLNEQDLFDWMALQNAMVTEIQNQKAEIIKKKELLEVAKGKEIMGLKSDTSVKMTEKMIDVFIREKFYEQNIELQTMKTTVDLLDDISKSIPEFINIVKLSMKSNL